MRQYLDLLADILANGAKTPDRTGVGTLSVFGRQLRFDLEDGFPLVTTKRLHWPSIVRELLWMLRGETNVRALQEAGVTIWDEWADQDGELGPIYGHQWRAWPAGPAKGAVDQIARVQAAIRNAPFSRRHVVSAWNVANIDDMALPPCHCLFQFHVAEVEREGAANSARRLSCQVYQRSADVFLGLPFNIASYALLTHMMAQTTGCVPGDLVFALGDVHLYLNHQDQARLQLQRKPHKLPILALSPSVTDVLAFGPDSIWLQDYMPWPAIKGQVAV